MSFVEHHVNINNPIHKHIIFSSSFP